MARQNNFQSIRWSTGMTRYSKLRHAESIHGRMSHFIVSRKMVPPTSVAGAEIVKGRIRSLNAGLLLNCFPAEKLCPSMLPKWLSEAMERFKFDASIDKETDLSLVCQCPDFKSSAMKELWLGCLSDSERTSFPLRITATAKRVESEISQLEYLIAASRLSAVSLKGWGRWQASTQIR